MLGVAVAALASCTNEEVVEVAQNRAIKFDSFVNNNTRAVVSGELNSQSDLTSKFFVFGKYDASETGSFTGEAFNNDNGDRQVAWVDQQYYRFAAYADGNAGAPITDANVTYDVAKQTLTFNNYVPDDKKDLVAATAKTGLISTSATQIDKVPLKFQHMLSQVKFTFQTKIDADYTLAISDIKVNAIKTGKGVYQPSETSAPIKWEAATAGQTEDYAFGAITDLATPVTGGQGYSTSAVSLYVIPQSNADLEVTFTVKLHGLSITEENAKTANLKAKLAYDPADTSGNKGIKDYWTPGFKYNYTATIDMADISDDLKIIEFAPSVDNWTDAEDETPDVEDNTTVTP